jgi:hypothetical protein
MPKIGKKITFNNRQYKVRQHNVLKESIVIADDDGQELTLTRNEWQNLPQSAAKDK